MSRWLVARRRVIAVEVFVALHAQTMAALLRRDRLRRAGKAWAASAARRYRTLAQRIAQNSAQGSSDATLEPPPLPREPLVSCADRTPDLVSLSGAKKVRASEPAAGGLFNDPLLIVRMREEFVEVEPEFELRVRNPADEEGEG